MRKNADTLCENERKAPKIKQALRSYLYYIILLDSVFRHVLSQSSQQFDHARLPTPLSTISEIAASNSFRITIFRYCSFCIFRVETIKFPCARFRNESDESREVSRLRVSDCPDKLFHKEQCCSDGRSILPMRADQDLFSYQWKRRGRIYALQEIRDILIVK